MCLIAKNFGLQEENINISKPQGNTTIIRKTGWGTTERERERLAERGGRMPCVVSLTGVLSVSGILLLLLS